MRHENIRLVSDCAAMAAVIEITKSKEDVLSRGYTSVSCLQWRCDLFGKLSRRRHSVVASLGDKVRDFVATVSTHRISRDFFSCHITCASEATNAIFTARWRRDN